MISGSCCCGAVRFELKEQPEMMGTCHCSRCRKIGASTIIFTKQENFTLLSGNKSICYYPPEKGYQYTRSFCGICGSSLGEIGSQSDSFPIPANLFDDELELTVKFHEFTSEKPHWYEITDDTKQFSGHPHS
ncbi:GFA family protein [Sneathiella glossodoripedis]|uniref:GFA family protein n=1 Tax=Sneathiella glossodoripedis TaxID=418853 RepID=UPI000472EF2C|nr:GFA family protein [Sneathiella glossodoripedis]